MPARIGNSSGLTGYLLGSLGRLGDKSGAHPIFLFHSGQLLMISLA
jgi:hypothetical protein